MSSGRSMFANRQDGKGRTLQWENLRGQFAPNPEEIGNQFVETYDGAAGNQQWVLQMVGENLTRGQVLLERIRGQTFYWNIRAIGIATGATGGAFVPGLDLSLNNGRELVIWESIQLVPVVDGGIDTTINANAFLQISNAADQESPRFLWQRMRTALYYPSPSGDVFAAYQDNSCHGTGITGEVDVKVKRRWSRSQWGLFYCLEFVPAQAQPELNTIWSGNFRGLFRSTDSL